ncbi:hypothetical protein CPC08DRAFT_767941 [Agrocybe pediades]|nr:hypothetical protein CPC08DRAFT_767941 [Agrocybe pediades]
MGCPGKITPLLGHFWNSFQRSVSCNTAGDPGSQVEGLTIWGVQEASPTFSVISGTPFSVASRAVPPEIGNCDDEFPGQQFTRQNIQTAYGVNHSVAAGDFTLFASDLLTFVPDAAARQMSDINFDIYVHFLMLLYKEEVERRIQKRGLECGF